jgi:hypothetical protein
MPELNPIERHLTPKEIAAAWRVDPTTVRRVFENEPGVLVIAPRASRGRRSYTTVRIPQAVYDRVVQRRAL